MLVDNHVNNKDMDIIAFDIHTLIACENFKVITCWR